MKEVIPIEDWVKGYERFFGYIYLFGPQDRKKRIKLAIAGAKVFKNFKNEEIVNGYDILLPYEAVAEDIRDEVRKITKGKGIFREK